ncbi:MAG: hypothetical protein ABI091_10775, partial [Ferruginibacter sp.]
MSRTIKSVLFGLLLCAGLLSCEKEYSVENGNGGSVSSGTAVYNFDGAPGACTLPVINGTYQVGTAMGVGNNIIVTVNVITPGTYTISTGSVNGVTFSASSSFAQAGPAIIQLAASGTPTAAGPFNYTPGANGCAFSVTFTGGGGVSTGTANYACTSINSTGTYTAGTTLGTSNTLVLQVNVTTPGTYNITTGVGPAGFGFSGSGTLAMGAQTIILAATGIPSAQGTATFTIGTGCTVIITVGAASGGGTGTDFLKATISGTVSNFNTSLSGQINNSASGPSILGIDGSLNSTASDDLSISFNNTSGLITTGGYSSFSVSNFAKFGVILYTDNAGNTYTSNPANANTATFNIATLTPTGATGTFSGTVTITTTTGTGFGTATKAITA